MPLYKCDTCGCVENTAVGFYYDRANPKWPESVRGKQLCSACGPVEYPSGEPTGFGAWHGQFVQRPAAGMLLDSQGHLWSKATRDTGNLPASIVIVGEV